MQVCCLARPSIKCIVFRQRRKRSVVFSAVKEVSGISVDSAPSQDKLQSMGVQNWPIWSSEVAKFPWTYDDRETCYVLEGEVIVTPDGGEPVEIKKGDVAVFPKNMTCTWDVKSPIRKHYNFG
eukprot:TRINITY_DN11410_c0_g1_i1.p2 TRINITY_DN11410_c0_g1~~TRINITY_DN11410_c0_g1_i1.p2  ORF type:complete len:140 (-),score=20.44 TRINITY_DN11410_c0_g1_i1:426-794(-)